MPTLGTELEQARQRVGYSHRRLATFTGIPASRLNRLLKDEVERPAPASLARLAGTLGLSMARLFKLANYPYPSLDDVLKADFGLSDVAVAEVHRVIEEHAAPERRPL